MRYWRLLGVWSHGLEFLIVLGKSPDDCKARLKTALQDYNERDLQRIRAVKLQCFMEDRREWMDWEEVPLAKLGLSRKRRRSLTAA